MKKRWILLAMLVSMLIASAWQSVAAIKNTAHLILDPTLGRLLNFNVTIGMFILVFLLTLLMSLIQKYTTDQAELKRIKDEQKKIQEEMKKHRDNQPKIMELNQKQMEHMSNMFKISMSSFVYTAIPIVLLFRWFGDYFAQPMLIGFKFLGLLSWFWFYLIFSIIFSSLIRKMLKVA